MNILIMIALTVLLIASVLLIFIISIQTTKSEESGSGMGWGTIGGQASTSITKFGLDAQLTRVTTWIAIIFFASAVITAVLEAKSRMGH